jgi:hypothetical protein
MKGQRHHRSLKAPSRQVGGHSCKDGHGVSVHPSNHAKHHSATSGIGKMAPDMRHPK